MFRFCSHAGWRGFVLATLWAACVWNNSVGEAQSSKTWPVGTGVAPGIYVFESMNSVPFAGKRIGLVTNQTGVDPQGIPSSRLFPSNGGTVVALFSPEHGIDGQSDSAVASRTDSELHIPIYSLYGETRRPTDEMLKNVDVLAFDIQDAGVRFYTYVTTMAYCMEAAAKHHIPFVVFDRPDPLGGEVIEGPVLDVDRTSFTGYFSMPVRYGMTLGELARMFNAENRIGAELRVFSMGGWRRGEAYDETGLKWIPPSPNLRTVDEAFLYPGVEILQAGGVSVGRGTDTPFEIVGAPWIHADELAAELERRAIPGVRFATAQFTPSSGVYSGQLCSGVKMKVTDRSIFGSIRMGIEIADALHRLYPDRFESDKIDTLLGSRSTIERLRRGDAPADIVAGWAGDLEKFRKVREKYLLYH